MVRQFERCIVFALMAMMMLVVALTTIDLAYVIARDIATAPIVLLEVGELFGIFGFFLLVLIGLELLETIKDYVRDKIIRVDLVVEVALIAVARKVIVLDFAQYDGLHILALAALIVALAIALVLAPLRRKLTSNNHGDQLT